MKRGSLGVVMTVFTVAAVLVLVTGCSTFGFSFSGLVGARQARPASPPVAVKEAPRDHAASAQAFQVRFDAMYSGFWSVGWFGYRDHRYKPGQATVWEYRNAGGGSDRPMIFERAYLRGNSDGTQWWRLRVESDGDTVVFEFLVDADGRIRKVRYRDPDGGAIGEFVPDQGRSPGGSHGPRSRGDVAKLKTDKQTVRVKAGGFGAEHYVFSDDGGTVEGWVSDSVPGYMVKTVYKSTRDNRTSTGELVRIEIGVTTELGSF